MKKDAYISVLVSESVKQAFQEALERDPRQLTQSQMVRHWIERYIVNEQDQGADEISELQGDISKLKRDLEAKDAVIEEFHKLVQTLYKLQQVSSPQVTSPSGE